VWTPTRFIAWAIAAAALDLWTKALAELHLADRAIEITDRFALLLVINTGAAGGVSLGPHTWLINVLSTLATILLVTAAMLPLARLVGGVPRAMGLIAGGAAGNLLSLLGPARGVPDFLALHLTDASIVFNVADVALWIGALLLIPMAWRLYGMARTERAERETAAAAGEQVAALRLRALTGTAAR
jgi:signal peptidase II